MFQFSRGVTDAVDHGGVWTHPANGQTFSVLQHVTIKALMQGRRPNYHRLVYKPYIEAKKQKPKKADVAGLFDLE